MLLHCNNYAPKDPLLSPCKGEAGYEPPSYPPWGKIDYALRLRFFLSFIHSFILAFLPFFLSCVSFFLKGGLCIQPPPYRGIRGGLRVFFFSFYLYIFLSLYKKENK